MENKIPTAEETRLKYIPNGCVNIKGKGLGDGKPQKKYEDALLDQMLIEFAKLHVEAALKEAFLNSEMRVSENDTNEYPSFVSNYDDGYVTITVSRDSILNAYPLTNIK